jgi:hypothetical protein
VVFAALALVAACAPSNIARASCTNTVLSTINEWTCTVSGAVVAQANTIEFDTESRNQLAQVSMELRVTKGSLRVRYADLKESHNVVVTPSEPASISMKTKLYQPDRSFSVLFEPVNGTVEGLSGTVKYSDER